MNIPILRGLVLVFLPALLAWPATLIWAAENTAVPATTPTSDFTLDDSNGTAYHKKTGLTWKRCAEGQSWSGDTCTGTASTYIWSAALQRGPALGTFAGFNDWRLPNQKELNSIVEQRNWSSAINATVFPNTPTTYFWSASPVAPIASFAWSVDFNDGNDDAYYEGNDYAVRLVRGGQYSLASVSKAGSGSGTVISSQPGIDCGQFCKSSFANEMFTAGQVVLTATPDANSDFGGWTNCPSASGAQCTVGAAGDRTVTATFTANTTTAITSDAPDPSVVGQAVAVNFTVAAVAGTPTGNVTVSDGTDSCTGTVAAGTCNLTFTSAGTKTLTATYAGDANFNGSTSAGASHEVLARTAQGNAGGGLVTAAITGGTCIGFATGSTSFPAPPTPLPPGVTFPYGLFGFIAVCPPQGGTLTLTVTYPNPLPPGTQYWKYGPTADNNSPHWYTLNPPQAVINGNTATFTITDGGLGDDVVPTPDGFIVDQGGPGVLGAGDGTTGIPTLHEWALLLLSALFGGLLWRTRRRVG